jgi:tetratricopeptide (TPR) repeat protein
VFLSLALSVTVAGQIDATNAARAVVGQAIHAVEGDTIAAVASRWSARLQRDSTDRAAGLGLATLARLTYDYPTSERLYDRLFRADSPDPDSYAAYSRLGRAWSLEERGRSDAAGEEFARARRAAHAAVEPAAEAEALIGLAFARGAAEGIAVGLALLDTAGHLVPAWALDLQAERGWRRATLLSLLADPRATAEAVASVELARRSGELRPQGQALRGLAKVLDWRGEDDSALAVLREAESRFRRARDRSWLAVTLMNRANALRKRGDLSETMATLRLTLTEGERSHNLWAVASAHTGLGVVALQLNDFTTAEEHLHRAVAMFERQGDRSSAMNARKFLPLIALADRNFPAARQQALAALTFYRRTGETLDQFAAHRMLATIALREKDWSAVERALADERALLARLEGPQWRVALAFDEARLARARGELASAERSFRRFLRSLDDDQHAARYDGRLRLADIAAQRGDLDAAEREAVSAWDDLERWRSALSDRELRLLAFQVARSEYQVSPAGVLVEGEGVQGLTAPLIQAGARSVVASQWRIPDRSVIPFIESFYHSLADGLTVGDALRAAKLDALGRGAPAGVWAGFTTVGDPLVSVRLRKPASGVRQAAVLVAAIVVSTAATAYWWKRQRAVRPASVSRA